MKSDGLELGQEPHPSRVRTLGQNVARLRELLRFYQAAIANTGFGISAYFLLVWLGFNPFAAQAIAHIAGMAFNYVTYSRHVFRGAAPAKLRFTVSYAAAYLVNVAALAMFSRFIHSPYMAGLAVAASVSLLNYFVLKRLVFRITAQ